jgi:hypothetical protein
MSPAKKSTSKKPAKRASKRASAKKSAAPRESFAIARGPHDETDHMITSAHAAVGDEASPAIAPPAHVPRQGDAPTPTPSEG